MKKMMLKKWLVKTLCLCGGLLMISCSKDKDPQDEPVFPKTNITQVKEYIETVTADYAEQFQSELELANNLQFYIKMANGMSKVFESADNELLNNMLQSLKSLIQDRDLAQLVYLRQTFPFDCKIILDERTVPPTGSAYSVRFIQSDDTIPGIIMDRMGKKRILLDYYTEDSLLVETNITMQYEPDTESQLIGKTYIEQMALICSKSVSISMSLYDKKGYFIGNMFDAIIYPSVDVKTYTFKATSRIDFPNGRSLSFTDIVSNMSKVMNASLDIFGQTVFSFSYNETGANQFDCQFGFKTQEERVVQSSMIMASLGQELSLSFENFNDPNTLKVVLPVILSELTNTKLTVQDLTQILKIEDPLSYTNRVKTSVFAYKISYGFDAAAEISLVEREGGRLGFDLIAQDGTSCPVGDVKFFGKSFNELFEYLMNMVKKLSDMGIMIKEFGFSSKIFDIFLK